MRIRGGRGLGDSIYQRPIVEHFIAKGNQVTVASDYPEVFIGAGCDVIPFTRDNIDVLAHYSSARENKTTTQYQDMCISAKIIDPVPLQFKWKVINKDFIKFIRKTAQGKRIIIVHGGRVPMARTDGIGMELLPDKRGFDVVLSQLADCFLVRVGNADHLYPLQFDLDLNGTMSVSDLLDLASVCDGIVAQCSFCVPLAEVFDKPLLAVWASAGIDSVTWFVKSTTPRKILTKESSRFVMDNWHQEKIKAVVDEFRRF